MGVDKEVGKRVVLVGAVGGADDGEVERAGGELKACLVLGYVDAEPH